MEKLFSWKQHSKIAKVHNLKVKTIGTAQILFIIGCVLWSGL